MNRRAIKGARPRQVYRPKRKILVALGGSLVVAWYDAENTVAVASSTRIRTPGL